MNNSYPVPSMALVGCGSEEATGGTNDYDGLDLQKALFALTGSAPYTLKVTGKMIGGGKLKLGEGGGSYAQIGAATEALSADANFALTGTVTAANATNKVRISSGTQGTATPSYIVTEIEIEGK